MLMFKRTFWRNHVEDQDGKVIQQGTLLEQDQFNRMEVGISDSNMAANIIHINGRYELMNVIELNEGRKVEYELRGTKLDFADGTLTMNLAKYQRDYPVTKTITGDAEGNLLIDGSDSRFYVAEVEIPAIEYEDVEVEGEAENATMTEAVEGETEAAEDTTAEDTAHKTHIERKAKPLNTDDVTLRLWSIEDFDIL